MSSTEQKLAGSSLPRLSEQDSRFESEESQALNEEQEEVMDVAFDVVTQLAAKLSRIGVQIIPLEKLETLEFSMSRDLISPLNAELVLDECLKVQFRNLETPSTFALFDRMEIFVEPLSVQATVKDLEVLQQIFGSVAGSWNRYSEYNSEFAAKQAQARAQELQKMQMTSSHLIHNGQDRPSDGINLQEGIFISEQRAEIENFLMPVTSREDKELSREHSQQFMSCVSHKVSGQESHYDRLPQSRQKLIQDYESAASENYESGKVAEPSLSKQRRSRLRHDLDNMDSSKHSQKTQSRRSERQRRNVALQPGRYHEKDYQLLPSGKEFQSMRPSQAAECSARDLRTPGTRETARKQHPNNMSRISGQSRHSYRSRRSMISQQTVSEEPSQFHDAQSRFFEKESDFSSDDGSSLSRSQSSREEDDGELHEESFMSCRVPFSANNSAFLEQPSRIPAVRAQEYVLEGSPQR